MVVGSQAHVLPRATGDPGFLWGDSPATSAPRVLDFHWSGIGLFGSRMKRKVAMGADRRVAEGLSHCSRLGRAGREVGEC